MYDENARFDNTADMSGEGERDGVTIDIYRRFSCVCQKAARWHGNWSMGIGSMKYSIWLRFGWVECKHPHKKSHICWMLGFNLIVKGVQHFTCISIVSIDMLAVS